MIKLLKSRRFGPLFLTQFLAAFNDNLFKNALVVLIAYRAAQTGANPGLLVTAAAGLFILPFFLFSATAGHLADGLEKSRMIRIVRLMEIPVMLLAAAGFLLENYAMLMTVLFAAGVMAAFFGPLKYSILPEHLPEQDLAGANGLIEAGTFAAILLGTISGGLLILRDSGTAIISLILMTTATLCWLCSRQIPTAGIGTPGLRPNLNIAAQTWRLIRDAAQDKKIFTPILGISWFWLVGFTFLAQFPVYASRVLGADEQVVTLFLTAFSIGIGAGSLACNRLLKHKTPRAVVTAGALGMAAGAALFWALSPHATLPDPAAITTDLAAFLQTAQGWGILIALSAIAASGGAYIVPLYTALQTQSRASHRSRAVAANNVMNALFMVTGALGAMLMVKLGLTSTQILLVTGLLNLPAALYLHHTQKS